MTDILSAEIDSCINVFVKIFHPLCAMSMSSKFLILLTVGYRSNSELLFNLFYPTFFWALTFVISQKRRLSVCSKQGLLIAINEIGLLILKKLSNDNFEHRSIYSVFSAFLMITFQMTPVVSYSVIAILSIKHIVIWYFYDMYFNNLEFSFHPSVFLSIIGCVFLALVNTYYRRLNIQKVEMYKRFLEENNQNMQNLIETLPSGLILLDKDLLPVSANIKAKELLDCQQHNLIHKLQALRFQNDLTIYDSVQTHQHIPINSTVSFGNIFVNQRYIDICTSKIKWGNSFVYVILFNDVTDTILLETNKTENECKTLLLRFIPHELRNPIVGMCGYTDETLKSLKNQDLFKTKKNLNKICRLSKMLKLFVYNISDYTEMFSNVCKVEFKPTNIRNKINEALDLVKFQIEKKKLRLIVRIDSYIPEKIMIDSERLLQLLIILLMNSVKYTYKGKIEIIATLIDRLKIKIEVIDTGIGIPREKLAVILNHLSWPIRGCLFFGLELANKIAKLLGNQELKIKSNQGTKVKFYIKIGESENFDNSWSPCPSSQSFSTNLRPIDESHNDYVPSFDIDHSSYDILVVDDSEINRNILALLLKSRNYRFLEAHDGKEAVEAIQEWDRKQKPIKIVIMDIDMPVMDGLVATKAINDLYDLQQISCKPFVIGYSAFTAPKFIEESYKLGMVTYLKKPAKAKDILQIIRNLLAN